MTSVEENVNCTCDCGGSSSKCVFVTADDIINQTFETSDVAYNLYVRYARCVGFGVCKGDIAQGKYGTHHRRRFFCNKEGKRARKNISNSSRKRENIVLTCTCCEAMLVVYFDTKTLTWRRGSENRTSNQTALVTGSLVYWSNRSNQWFNQKNLSESAEMLYTCKHVVHGFSTRLTNQEAEALSKQPGILSLIPERNYELHTTITPYFLGLDLTFASLDRFSTHLPASVAESELIIGVVDSGIWPTTQ
ncbi:uncharacterized protein LOC127748495 [Arachis duranensis]|uniref:Uncharacterized protein LOC127748495 n=1 Tax=Arachis duranensis TaxID=130453 RepID=A0A9C6TY86_ARADU|nr:uncharacterized protein LOC127748495 [Arachis duranensis]